MDEALTAVHQTLERIVNRLDMFADEPGETRDAVPNAAPRPTEGFGGASAGERDGHGAEGVLSHDQLLTDPEEAARQLLGAASAQAGVKTLA